MAEPEADLLPSWQLFDGRFLELQGRFAESSAQSNLSEAYRIAAEMRDLTAAFAARWRGAILLPDVVHEIDERGLFVRQLLASVGAVAGHWPESRVLLEGLVAEFTDERRAMPALALGTGLANRAEYRAALPWLRIAADDAGDSIPTKVQALCQMANSYLNLEEFTQSAAAHEAAVALAREHGLGELAAQLSLRKLYFETLRDATGAARDRLRKEADELKRTPEIASSPRLRIEACQMLADYYGKIGESALARDEVNEALDVASGNDDLQLRWRTLQNYAQTEKNFDRAIRRAEEATTVARTIGSPEELAQSLQLAVSLRLDTEDVQQHARAEEEWSELSNIADSETLFTACLDRALQQARRGRIEASLASLEEAQSLVPQRSVEVLYARAAVLMRAGRDAEAATVASDALARIDPTDTRRRSLVQRTNLHRMLAQIEARRGNPELAIMHAESTRALTTPIDCEWADLQAWLNREDVAAVYIFVSENSAACLIAEPGRAPRMNPLALTVKQIAEVMPSRDSVDAEAWNRALVRGIAAIGGALAQALHEVCARNRVVYLFPESNLAGFPFSALSFPDGSGMVDLCALVFAPALRIAKEISKKKTSRGALLAASAGGETGVDFRSHSEEIAALPFWESVRHVPDASAFAFLEEAPAADVIHLACHGTLAGQTEEGMAASEVELAGYERLSAKEISRLTLQTDLVFLNACRSGVFRTELYSETGGFWRAFLDAGAASLVATLGYVEPGAAQRLAVSFYKAWRAGEISKAEALRQAQAEAARTSPDPLTWASHLLIGCHR